MPVDRQPGAWRREHGTWRGQGQSISEVLQEEEEMELGVGVVIEGLEKIKENSSGKSISRPTGSFSDIITLNPATCTPTA